MQGCLENPAVPLVEPSSLPLLDDGSLPAREPAPTWIIRLARPRHSLSDDLAQELRGVPKAALRHVFGKALGTRLWQQNRTAPTTAKPARAGAISPVAPIPDSEISSGMLRHLCAEAAATLREHKRLAKSISLTVSYSDGECETVRKHLLLASSDATSLETAARLALRGARSRSFVSLKLNLAATPAQS